MKAIDFLTGKIGKFGDSAMEFAKNISVEGLQKGWDTYMVQSPDELAKIARERMQRKNTILSNLDMSKLDAFYSSADKSNAEYIKEFNKLKGAISEGNIEDVRTAANTISERFQDGNYLELLREAEGTYHAKKEGYDTLSSSDIKSLYENNVTDALSKNKIANNFLEQDGKARKKIAQGAYKAQGLSGYFNSGDAKTNRIRASVVGGTYLGGSMIVRGLQGGTPLTNEYGERDIAGIPFI